MPFPTKTQLHYQTISHKIYNNKLVSKPSSQNKLIMYRHTQKHPTLMLFPTKAQLHYQTKCHKNYQKVTNAQRKNKG